MSDRTLVRLETLREIQKRLPKRLSWQENYTPCNTNTYNKALSEARKVIREMMAEYK